MYVIVKKKDSWKGKSISEMAHNLQSEGYPAEVKGETMDRIKFMERKYGPNVFKRR